MHNITTPSTWTKSCDWRRRVRSLSFERWKRELHTRPLNIRAFPEARHGVPRPLLRPDCGSQGIDFNACAGILVTCVHNVRCIADEQQWILLKTFFGQVRVTARLRNRADSVGIATTVVAT
jgi:hypothetical protein